MIWGIKTAQMLLVHIFWYSDLKIMNAFICNIWRNLKTISPLNRMLRFREDITYLRCPLALVYGTISKEWDWVNQLHITFSSPLSPSSTERGCLICNMWNRFRSAHCQVQICFGATAANAPSVFSFTKFCRLLWLDACPCLHWTILSGKQNIGILAFPRTVSCCSKWANRSTTIAVKGTNYIYKHIQTTYICSCMDGT